MINETTPFGQGPEVQQESMGGLLRERELQEQSAADVQAQTLQPVATAGAVQCPHCGAANDPTAVFCEACGVPLRMGSCPNCGSPLDPDADFCEVCHHYVRPDVCSFCGAHVSDQDAFCPECGSPRGGIVCPVCHTLNDFAFCRQCGMPLTDEARQLAAELKAQPEYQELMALAREYNELGMKVAFTTEQDLHRDEDCMRLRDRVLRLLALDEGETDPVIPEPQQKRFTKEELDKQKEQKLARLSELLDRMAVPELPSPARVRNYAMAQKPVGMRLAWVCNWKHAMHSSPCGCAKPQLGGKWVILGHNTSQEIKDDK